MTDLLAGRITHDHDGGVVVFLIGMRINRFRAVRDWLPVARAMPRMLRELTADPALGLLGAWPAEQGPRAFSVVQYWRDAESLLAYATASDHTHRPAWTAFNRSARESGGAVGIWHETFVVPAGGHESLYVDLPRRGLGQAFEGIAATGRRATASGRLGRPEAIGEG
jgi:Domain of unknown function (DUF4188)